MTHTCLSDRNINDPAHSAMMTAEAGDKWSAVRKVAKFSSAVLLVAAVAEVVVYATSNDDENNFFSDNNGQEESSWIRRLAGNKSDDFHKPLHPIGQRDIWGFVFATIGLMIAAGGGIGGGGLLVPIYILILGFSPKHAIPLSNITVFGGAIANTALNWNKRHPLADRPLIDWDLIMVMEPLTIAGALCGAFLNKVLPERFLVIMLVLLLGFTGFNTMKKARKMYKKETLMLQSAASANESELTKLAREEGEEDDEEAAESLLENMESSSEHGPMEEIIDDDLKKILEEERNVPYSKVKALILMFVVVLFMNIMKGGGAFKSPLRITCGSTSFWIANIFILGWIGLVSMFARATLVEQNKKKEQVNFRYVEGDIKWDARATIIYPIICMAAGFFAGMFGVGGGIVKGPLMLEMGVHPAVSSACSACMILFTSFTATTSFIVFGLLVQDYAVICLIIGFIATIVGQLGLNRLMELFGNRNSFIAFSIGSVVLLSAFLMTVQYLVSLAEGKVSHSSGICGKE